LATRGRDIAADLAALIAEGRWQSGDRLPSETALAAQFGVSRPTLRKALTVLASEGLVESVQGSGWFVCPDRRLNFPLDGIDRGPVAARDSVWNVWVRSLGRTPTNTIAVSNTLPPRDVAARLRLEAQDYCLMRRRLRSVDGEPWMLCDGYFPLAVCAGTPLAECGEGDAVDMHHPTPVAYLAAHGFAPHRSRSEVGARMPTEFEAGALDINPAIPVITMLTTSYTGTDRPIRCAVDIFPAHRFLLTTTRGQTQ
jgi:GntR family transcriptional regulator